jgi:DNA mismatch repair protein MSH4
MEASISTFLMEMKETAYILNRANPRSLVLIDELGRGTSDTEGFTIAWAVCEFIVRTRSLAMFVVGASPWSLVRLGSPCVLL